MILSEHACRMYSILVIKTDILWKDLKTFISSEANILSMTKIKQTIRHTQRLSQISNVSLGTSKIIIIVSISACTMTLIHT
jgi:hypothetical protein